MKYKLMNFHVSRIFQTPTPGESTPCTDSLTNKRLAHAIYSIDRIEKISPKS